MGYATDYRLGQFIARGGMGEVYEAFDERLKRPVAMKVLRADLAQDDVNKQRFLKEAHLSAAIDHPNVVRVYDTGWLDDGRPYLIMELLHGETLSRRISRGPLHTEEARTILSQVLLALNVLHQNRIVHRDVKPSNIFLTHDGTVKLLDFGIAVGADELRLTQMGYNVGAPHYMSPEQIDSREPTAASDIYSSGVMLYEMLMGRPPFDGNPHAITYAHMNTPPPHVVGQGAALDWVVQRAMQKDPRSRFASAREMRDALLGQKPPAAAPSGVAPWVIGGALVLLALFIASRPKPNATTEGAYPVNPKPAETVVPTPLPAPHTHQVRMDEIDLDVSSVLDNNISDYGGQLMFDNNSHTAWNGRKFDEEGSGFILRFRDGKPHKIVSLAVVVGYDKPRGERDKYPDRWEFNDRVASAKVEMANAVLYPDFDVNDRRPQYVHDISGKETTELKFTVLNVASGETREVAISEVQLEVED